jgi:hypothetical protein
MFTEGELKWGRAVLMQVVRAQRVPSGTHEGTSCPRHWHEPVPSLWPE